MLKKRLRIYGPLLVNIFLLIFFYSKLYKNLDIVLVCILVSTAYSICAWESARWLTLTLQKKIPGINNIRKRLIYIFLYGLPLTLVGTFFNQIIKLWVGFFKSLTIIDFTFIEGLNILISLIIVGIYEGLYYLEQWRGIYAEAEKIRKINENSQYEFLEEQIKPHFLFNSLNTLASLISYRPQTAIQFVEEMSTVYRYLLKRNGNKLTTLGEELTFVESYLHMLEIRFEGSIITDIKIDPDQMNLLIPPFVLQILIENSVKHNVCSKEKPLYIRIKSEGESVISVTNNLQKKNSQRFSEKKGLTNLIERYKLLQQDHNLYILEETDIFSVKIPLLQKHVFSSAHQLY
jgi:two-component system LytT family sensor kinase